MVALAECAKEAVKHRRLVQEILGNDPSSWKNKRSTKKQQTYEPTSIKFHKAEAPVPFLFVDNKGALHLSKTASLLKRCKHIDIRYHFARQLYENGQIKPEFVPTHLQLADFLTKPLDRTKLETALKSINLKLIQRP